MITVSASNPAVLNASTLFETVPCNLCGGTISILLFKVKNFQIVKCAGCGLVFTNPRLKHDQLQAIYDQTYFQSKDSLVHGYENYANEKLSIQRTFEKRWKLIKRYTRVQQGALLDVGCALGYLLEIAKKEGWTVKGLDTSDYAVAYARETLGLDVEKSSLSDLPFADQSFDVIVLWDVIEHLPDPTRVLRRCYDMLRPNGVLSLITPDQKSLMARALGQRWVEYQKPHEHIYFFSKSNLSGLLEKTGFSVQWRGTAGKYVTLEFALERLQAYQATIFKFLLRAARSLQIGAAVFHANPRDKMSILATKPGRTNP